MANRKSIEDVKYCVLAVRVNERMKGLVERRAKGSGMNVSEYIKHAVLLDSMICGDIESMKIIAGNLKEKLRESALRVASIA